MVAFVPGETWANERFQYQVVYETGVLTLTPNKSNTKAGQAAPFAIPFPRTDS